MEYKKKEFKFFFFSFFELRNKEDYGEYSNLSPL